MSALTAIRLEKEAPIDILEIDNSAVRLQQIDRLNQLKANRNEADVQAALAAITKCVETKEGNLLELAVEAARVRASLGEISYACEKIVGRYKASNQNHIRRVFIRNKERCRLSESLLAG